MVGKGSVKCAKCGITSKENSSLTFHRFPLPSIHGSLKARVWAKFCYPNDDCTSDDSLVNLNKQHKMLCSNHFDNSSFTNSARTRLNKFAIPTEAQNIMAQLRDEHRPKEAQNTQDFADPCADAGDSDPVEKPRDLAEPCGDSGPVEEPRVEDTDICDDGDVDDDDSDTLLESNVCRVCLALDVKMYDLKDIELREMFQNITGIMVAENNHSILERICWECAGRLKAAAVFRHKALLSDALLQGLANTGEQIRKNDITLIKENKDYLKSAATLSIVEVFHTVQIDAEYESVPSITENNETDIAQDTVRRDSTELNESVIKENNDRMDDEDESIIEAPIKTAIEYDHISLNTGEENRNVVLERNLLFTNNIPLKEDKISSAYSSPAPGCSHAEPKYKIIGYLQTPSYCENKIKKTVVKITNSDSISKIESKKSKELINHGYILKGDVKLKNINLKLGGVSKKTSNQKLVKKTQAKANTFTDVEYLDWENFEF